jgi:carotenoid cleavage dioxygenase-like enzyme
MSECHYNVGFNTLESEVTDYTLEVQGKLPDWIDGRLIRIGPAKFEVGNEKLNHWFDGLGMLYGFKFENQTLTYSNKYVRSKAYHANRRIKYREFATNPKGNFLSLLSYLVSPRITDNTNVNVGKVGNSYVSMTEVPSLFEFNAEDLSTKGTLRFQDRIPADYTTAHPHHDPFTGETRLLGSLTPISSLTSNLIGEDMTTFGLPPTALKGSLVGRDSMRRCQ